MTAGILLLTLCYWLLLGLTILECILPSRKPNWIEIGFRAVMGLMLGVGVSSCTYFVLGIILNRTVLLTLFADIAVLVVVTSAAYRMRLRLNVPAMAVSGTAAGWVPALVLILGIGVALPPLVRFWQVVPHGGWDAWMSWNVRAKFLAQTGSAWYGAVSESLVHGHPDYPLLLSASVGHCWLYTGDYVPIVPGCISVLFVLCAFGLLFFGIAIVRGADTGAVAAAMLLSTPAFMQQSAMQYADIPLSAFVLATFLCTLLSDLQETLRGRFLALAGLNAALSAWTKNEGILFSFAFAMSYFSSELKQTTLIGALKRIRPLLTGAAPVLLMVIWFKSQIVPANNPNWIRSPAKAIYSVFNFERQQQIIAGVRTHLLSFEGGFAYPLLILAVLLLCFGWKTDVGYRRSMTACRRTLACLLAAYLVVYLNSPYSLPWHLETSLVRVALQPYPAALGLCFLVICPRRDHALLPIRRCASPLMTIGTLLALVVLGGTSCSRVAALDQPDPTVVEEIAAQCPAPVSLSPDGTRVLTKTRTDNEFEIAVVSAGSSKISDRRRARDSQLSLTWRPDSRAVAYLADAAGNRQYSLFLWEPFANAHSAALPVPATGTAAPPLRWSPDGRYLAYFQGFGSSGRLLKIDLFGGVGVSTLLDDSKTECDFEWSPDGTKLAAISAAMPDAVTIVGPRKGDADCYPVYSGAELRDVAWAPDGEHLLVTARQEGAEYFELHELSLRSRSAKLRVRAEGDIVAPRYLDSSTIAYHVNADGNVHLYAESLTSPDRHRLGSGCGKTELRGNAPSHFVLYSGLTLPPELYSLVREPGGIRLQQQYSAPRGKALEAKPPEMVWIFSGDGMRIPIDLWRRSPSARPSAGVVVLVHGGPHLQEFPIWSETAEILNRRGIDMIAVNYRGSSGFGKAFEKTGDDDARARDIIAACDYAIGALHTPPGRVVVLGSSYGAGIAAMAAAAAPERLGGLVLLSIGGAVPRRPPPKAFDFCVSAFHGRNDPVASPAMATNLIEEILGPSALRPPRGRWLIFEEGHQFRAAGAWARVYTELLRLLPKREP